MGLCTFLLTEIQVVEFLDLLIEIKLYVMENSTFIFIDFDIVGNGGSNFFLMQQKTCK